MRIKKFLVIALGLIVAGCSQNSATSTAASTPVVPATETPVSASATVDQVGEAANKINAQVNSVVQNAADAIKQSVNQGSVQQQIDYLVLQAKSFIGAQKYDQVVAVANHILSNLDQNSTQAKELLNVAQAKLKEKSQALVSDAQNKLNSFMQK